MYYIRNKLIILSVYCLLNLLVLLVLNLSCEPMAPLRVENQTDETLSIYVKWQDEVYYVGDVAPGEEIKNDNPRILEFSSFPIEAKDAQGNVVYSRIYTMVEMTEKLHYKVVIPPLQKGLESSDNITIYK